MAAQVWAIAAGKGGVGKTFVCSSLGITLSKLNQSVLLIDFDLTGANLHTTLGLPLSERNLRQVFANEAKLVDVVHGTNIPRLSYIQGFWDSWSPNDVSTNQIIELIKECKSLAYDFVVFDLGAGPTTAHIEIFKRADEKILVTNSEPTSVEKNYRFLESYLSSKLKDCSTPQIFSDLQKKLREYRASDEKSHFSFRSYLMESGGITLDYFESFGEKPVRLIVNSARSRLDQDLGYSIKSVCKKYYDLGIDYLGAIDYDNAVWQSIKTKEPVLIEKPFTPIAGQFLTITKLLVAPNLNAPLHKAVV